MAYQVHGSDINTQLQRSRSDQHLHLAFLELPLRLQTQLARQTPVVRGDIFFAKPLGKLVRHPFRQPASIDKNQSRAMLVDELHDALVDLIPHLVRSHRP